MRVYGLDFTSAPGKKKPLIALGCALDDGVLRIETAEEMRSFGELEELLERPGEWVCGMDFPFGQPSTLIEALGWPGGWEGYVGRVAGLSREEFEEAIREDMARRPAGSKYRYRLADRRSGSASAMMLFRVPVGKMFYRGAPLLLASGASVIPCRPNDSGRVAVEAYPAVVARRFLGRRGYKSDEPKKQTAEHSTARERLVAGLESETLAGAYGITVKVGRTWRQEFVRDPTADALDSLLCAVQAAWAYRSEGWGIPPECDADEGWVLDPKLLEASH